MTGKRDVICNGIDAIIELALRVSVLIACWAYILS